MKMIHPNTKPFQTRGGYALFYEGEFYEFPTEEEAYEFYIECNQ